MTQEEFEIIVKPLSLLNAQDRVFMQGVLLGNFKNWETAKQLRLSEVSRSTKVKINEPFEVEEMGEKFEARINNYIDDNGLWENRIIIVKVD